MNIITSEVIIAIGKQIEPHLSAMDSDQLGRFHCMIETVCDKQVEIATLEYNMKKIEVLKSLIQLCVENNIQDNSLALNTLAEKLVKLV